MTYTLLITIGAILLYALLVMHQKSKSQSISRITALQESNVKCPNNNISPIVTNNVKVKKSRIKQYFTAGFAAILLSTSLVFVSSGSSVAEPSIKSAVASYSYVRVDSVDTVVEPAPVEAVPEPVVYSAADILFFNMTNVNTKQYNYGDPVPALEAFRIVTAQRGWTPEQIASWERAITNIMMGESGFCPNVLRGVRIGNPQGCVISRQGRYGDAGFGQLIGLHYRYPNGWLCKQEKLCSKWDIIATPYNSMTALVALIERSGTQGWCFNAWARRYHREACSHPGMDV
jgi:hypothetical protein